MSNLKIDADGTIIEHKDFKYAQIKLQKIEYEKDVLKHQQERELDREIEIAIRSKAKTDKQRMQEKYQTMGDPTKGSDFPEFLNTYPVTMWRTVLLYAERPPSLTHVGISRRPKTSKPVPISKTLTEAEKVQQMFANARKQFDNGDMEAVNVTLCSIISLIRRPSELCHGQDLYDHYTISNAIQEMIETAGLTLTSSERLLIGFIQKLGGNVEVVIQCLCQGRIQSEMNFKRIDTVPKIASVSSLRKSEIQFPSVSSPPLVRPQSARPARSAQYPTVMSFPNVIGSESAPSFSHLERPQSARKSRDAAFYPASDFSIGDNGSTISVHLERPTSARPNRQSEFPATSEFSSDIGSDREEEIVYADIEVSQNTPSAAGVVAYLASTELADVISSTENAYSHKSLLIENETAAEIHATENATDKFSSKESLIHEDLIYKELAAEPELACCESSKCPKSEAKETTEESIEYGGKELYNSIEPGLSASISHIEEFESYDSDVGSGQYEQVQEENETEIERQSAIKLGSAFLTQKDLDGFFEDGSEDSFIYSGIGGARSDSEIRSNSQIDSMNDSISSLCLKEHGLEKAFVASPLKHENQESAEMNHSLTSVSESLTKLAEVASRTGILT
ncbi:UNVERIFIED_CONTAM: hypothetical protein HDU68_003221 [Siphonaria sp. JEL0065]|nr:hypothetical protein HDU68_003221 [Siphonaria sp. JEL0065]